MSSEETFLDVGEYATLSNHSLAHDLVELLIVADGELNVTWGDSLLSAFKAHLTGKLEELTRQVLQDGCHEDSSTNSCLKRVATLLDESMASTDGENQITSA